MQAIEHAGDAQQQGTGHRASLARRQMRFAVGPGPTGAAEQPDPRIRADPSSVRDAATHPLHDARHSHAMRMLANGIHPKIAQERPGHFSVAITLDLYSHVLPGMQEDAAVKVDAALRAALDRTTGRNGNKALANTVFGTSSRSRFIQASQRLGRVAEWFKAAVLKTAVGATPPWVRIPPLPPIIWSKLLQSLWFLD